MLPIPVKKKNPVGRPRKDGLPPGSVLKKPKVAKAPGSALELTASGAVVKFQKRPRGRPRKDGMPPGSKRVCEASAPVCELAAEPALQPAHESSPSPSRHVPSLMDVGPSHKPKAGSFTHPATEGLYNIHSFTPSLDTETEFDDDTDEDDTDVDDTDVNETALGGTEKVLKRFRQDRQREIDTRRRAMEFKKDWERERVRTFDRERTKSRRDWDWGMFPGVEDERAQTEEERREASRQRQKRVCEAHGCYNQGCRINHVRRGNVAYFLEGLDERTSQLDEPVEGEAAAPKDNSTAVEGGKRLEDLMQTEVGFESQFELLFFGIMQERGRD